VANAGGVSIWTAHSALSEITVTDLANNILRSVVSEIVDNPTNLQFPSVDQLENKLSLLWTLGCFVVVEESQSCCFADDWAVTTCDT
jgi:hypothetical protein